MALRTLLFGLLFAGIALAQNSPERTRLYTPPDPTNPGGIKGRIVKPERPIEQILALPADNIEHVYAGEITGPKRDTFQFTGLPVGKYDLVVIYPDAFHEGIQLDRDPSTLTPDDLKKIDASIQKSEPFFTRKVVQRTEGQTGRGNTARVIGTYVREKGSELLLQQFEGKSNRPDFRRTYKLVMLKDVGPGWQIVRARDLYPVWLAPTKTLPAHHFSAALNKIRVADAVKDLGDLDISR